MNTSTTSDRLTQEATRLDKLCDQAIANLDRCIKLLEQIKANDTASSNAAHWLRNECHHRPYDGLAIVVPVESIYQELEDLEADQVFGPREDEAKPDAALKPTGNSGHYDICCLCAHQGNTAHDLRYNELVCGWVCDHCAESGIPEDVRRWS
jgi:hypothetical protein